MLRPKAVCALVAELGVLSTACYMRQSAYPALAIVLWVGQGALGCKKPSDLD